MYEKLNNRQMLNQIRVVGGDIYKYKYTYFTPIGKTYKGKLINTIKVVVDELGNIITAYSINICKKAIKENKKIVVIGD